MFSGYTVLLDSKENKLGSSNQETPASAGKNTGVVLVRFCACKCVPTASYFQECVYSHCFWVSYVTSDAFSVSATKITSGIGVSSTHSLPFCFWPIFNSMNYGDIIDQKVVNQITLNDATPQNITLQIFEIFVQILLNVNFSLNRILFICTRFITLTSLAPHLFLLNWLKLNLILLDQLRLA